MEKLELRQIDFEDLDLSEIDWKNEPVVDLVWGEEILELECIYGAASDWENYGFVVSGEGTTALIGQVTVQNRIGGQVYATIERFDYRARKLPKGGGMAFYQKMLDMIDGFKDRTHVVRCNPGDNDVGRWIERFGSILKGRGYDDADTPHPHKLL